MLPTESECRKIAERALSYARAEDASVSLSFVDTGNTRFANNEITTSGATESVSVVVTSTREGRTGRVSLNETSAEALERAMRRAEEIAALVPADPEYVGPLAKQEYAKITAWDEPTARLNASARLPGVRAVVEPAAQESFNASGFFTNTGRVQCIANRAGNFGWHRSTDCEFSATVRTPDGTGSGWAEDRAWRARDVDAVSLGARALGKARDSRGARALEPGDYTVILEPAAVAAFLQAGFGGGGGNQALSARAAEEGRSYFSRQGGGTRVGERVFHESVTLKTDPADPRRPTGPWAGATGGGGGGGGGGFGGAGADLGVATRPTVWVRNGVLENLSYDRYWARQAERAPTGPASGLILEGGTATIESLIAGTDRGLLVTNLWYIRSVNPQSMQLTGLTRDGVWLIESGKLAGAVTNFRFNESPAVMLQNVLGMTPATRAGNSVVPAVKAARFTFSSPSDAV